MTASVERRETGVAQPAARATILRQRFAFRRHAHRRPLRVYCLRFRHFFLEKRKHKNKRTRHQGKNCIISKKGTKIRAA
jgi:hypothetical protein